MGSSAITFPSIIIVFFALMAGEGGLAGEVSCGGNTTVRKFMEGPSVFVENLGQWQDKSIRFALDASWANVGLTDQGPRFQLFRRLGGDSKPADSSSPVPGTEGNSSALAEMREFGAVFEGAVQVAPAGRDKAARSTISRAM